MKRVVFLSGCFSIGLVLLAVAGCESTQTAQNPGALPRSTDASLAPRLSASTYIAHGQLLERQGNFQQAVDQYRRALDLTPDSVAARNRLGVALNKLGRHYEASVEFRAALARAPGIAYLQNNLGFSLYLERQFVEARDVLQRCIEQNPTFSRARMNLALALGQLRHYDQALAEFSLASNQVDAHYNVAMLQAQAGELDAAAASLEAALRLNPNFEPAREQLRVVARMAAEEEAARARAAANAATETTATTSEPTATVGMSASQAEPELASYGENDELDTLLAAWESIAPGASTMDTANETSELDALIDELIDAIVEDAPERENLLEDALDCLPADASVRLTDAAR